MNDTRRAWIAIEPALKTRRAVGVGLLGETFGQIAVLDHLQHAVADDEVADFFQRVGFGDRLAAHLAAGQVVQAEEQRDRCSATSGIIDLEVGEMLDAALLHVGQRAAICRVRGASRRDRRAEGRANPFPPAASVPSMANAGIMPCWKKKTSAAVVAEVVVLLEEVARGGVVRRRWS